MLSQSVKSEINKLWNKFWSGGISNPLTAIEQISYLLFMRRLDELDLREMKKAEFSGEKYSSIFQGTFQVPNSNEKIDKSYPALEPFQTDGRGRNACHMSRLRYSPLLSSLTEKVQHSESICVMRSL